MTTGLTVVVEEGGTFEEFVWRCARQMGPCIMMRDHPYDARVTRERVVENLDYHSRAVGQAVERFVEVEKMTEDVAEAACAQLYKSDVADYRRSIEDRKGRRALYESMHKKVKAWEIPNDNFEGLKDLMLDQLGLELNNTYAPSEPRRMTGEEYMTNALELAKKDVEYTKKRYDEAVVRNSFRAQWIHELNESVPQP